MLKGRVSTVDNENRKARVIFEDREDNVSPEITISPSVGILNVNEMVAVAVFSDSLADSLIIAKF